MMKLIPQVFRAKAVNARKLASTYQDQPYCGDMLALAGHWDELALAVEAFDEAKAPHRSGSATRRPSRRGRSGP
jgi:hypothetical protein